MALYKALHGRKCSTLGYDRWERCIDTDFGTETTEKMIDDMRLIRVRIKQAYDSQKSYTDQKRWDLEFDVGDMVFVRVVPYYLV